MSEDNRDTGIPTRAIHESYLNLQQAHRQYRQARDTPDRAEKPSHADYQDAVLTFYELIRPHLKRKSAMAKFWEGRLPDYPDRAFDSVEHAKQYYTHNGVAVWGLQKHIGTRATPNTAGGGTPPVADGAGSLDEYHDLLDLTDRQRVVGVEYQENLLTWIELRAVTGLQQLDSWDTREERRREQQSGFMASETTTTVELKYVPTAKLTKAKRLLAEAADKMNLLSRVDIDHEDGAILHFDQSREDAQPEYRDTEYNSSPDI